MIIVNELSPVVQRVVQDAVAANPKSSPSDFVRELYLAVSDPDSVVAIYEEWERAVPVYGGEGEEDEFDGDGFVHGDDPIVGDIFEEMRLLIMKLDGTYENI